MSDDVPPALPKLKVKPEELNDAELAKARDDMEKGIQDLRAWGAVKPPVVWDQYAAMLTAAKNELAAFEAEQKRRGG